MDKNSDQFHECDRPQGVWGLILANAPAGTRRIAEATVRTPHDGHGPQ
jgi:hypothetical protein